MLRSISANCWASASPRSLGVSGCCCGSSPMLIAARVNCRASCIQFMGHCNPRGPLIDSSYVGAEMKLQLQLGHSFNLTDSHFKQEEVIFAFGVVYSFARK